MSNSDRVKAILVEMAINDELPSDMNDLDSNLFSFCDPEPEAFGYNVVDIIERAEESDVKVTKGQAIGILELINRRGDCNNGVAWDDIDYWTEQYLKEV